MLLASEVTVENSKIDLAEIVAVGDTGVILLKEDIS